MILVVGSTGMVGSEVCRLLISKKFQVRAMIRSSSKSSKLNELEQLGVQQMNGDLCDKSTFPRVLNGISTVISTVSSMPFSYASGTNDIKHVDEEGMINFINEAKKQGVKHFIYTSFSKNFNQNFPLSEAKRRVEKHIQHCGMDYTILRPSCFMESWLTERVGFDALNGKVILCGDGSKPIAYISYKDVAKFAIECVSNPLALNTIFELGGPENMSQLDAVNTFRKLMHREIEIQQMSIESLQAQFDAATDPMQKSFAGLMLGVARGDRIEMKGVLKKFPIVLTSVEDFVHTLV
jgi:Predicted nucleoside-diphosphate-sugar epimerases